VPCPPNRLSARPKHGPARAPGRRRPVTCRTRSCSCWAKSCRPRASPFTTGQNFRTTSCQASHHIVEMIHRRAHIGPRLSCRPCKLCLWSWVKRNRSNLFFPFNRQTKFLNFSCTKGNDFLNSVLTKILKMKASFLGFFISKFLKFLKTSNSTSRFSMIRQTRPDRFCRFL
jgi:hypothetical protein